MEKSIVLICLVVLPLFGIGQEPNFFLANKINSVETEIYNSFTSENSKIKAKIEIRGEHNIKKVNFLFTINFYDGVNTKIEDIITFNGSFGTVTVFYPFEDFFFYKDLLKNYSQKTLTVIYENNLDLKYNRLLIK